MFFHSLYNHQCLMNYLPQLLLLMLHLENDVLLLPFVSLLEYLYFHFYLLSYYGPICPLRESPAVNESTQAVRVYREKVDDCFSYVLDLMDEVIESEALPLILSNPTTELGRFTQPAAYMLKAKILLYWASPLFN